MEIPQWVAAVVSRVWHGGDRGWIGAMGASDTLLGLDAVMPGGADWNTRSKDPAGWPEHQAAAQQKERTAAGRAAAGQAPRDHVESDDEDEDEDEGEYDEPEIDDESEDHWDDDSDSDEDWDEDGAPPPGMLVPMNNHSHSDSDDEAEGVRVV